MVIILDKNKKPYGWCTPKRAKKMIEKDKACVYRYYPFVIIRKDVTADGSQSHDYRIKIDPGAKYTGIAVVDGLTVVLFMQIKHRGDKVVKNLQARNANRRNRRSRETWYRRSTFIKNGRFDTPRPKGWLPPSQMSIVGNTVTWVKRLIRWLGPCNVSIETVKFDTQLMQNPDISGVEYQRGTLYGYEIRAYLMEKYRHTCQYCGGESGDPILEWEHMIPVSRGGSDSVKNATLACRCCNQAKSNQTPEEWRSKIRSKKKQVKAG